MSPLPAAPNSGQYLATFAYGSSSPRSTSIRAISATMVLVLDQTLVMVSSAQGVVRSGSAQPPHRSTSHSPSMITARHAPSSWSAPSRSASTSRSGSKRALQLPCTSVMGPI